MASLDALRHVAIGRYTPGDSALHRLDPRLKVGGFGLLVLLTALAGQLSGLALLLAASLALVLLAGLDLRGIWAGVRPALPVILVLLALQLLYLPVQPGDRVLLAWGRLQLGWPAVRLALVSLLRFGAVLLAVSLLTGVTTAGELTRGVEGLLRPLVRLGLPAHELALIAAVALRFLPLLGEQLESISLAQASRGLAERHGRWQLVANARRTAQLIVPLFVDVYRRSEELALAMQARCYNGGKGRTHLFTDHFARRDWRALLVLIIGGGALLALRWTSLP